MPSLFRPVIFLATFFVGVSLYAVPPAAEDKCVHVHCEVLSLVWRIW